MSQITLRVLDGSDRGRVFDEIAPPITIGREEGNTIQLNDERVSRFHIKIQEDHDDLVLTDLESTNGTKVNGEEIQLRILRHGDMITVGRSTLLFGTREQINQRLSKLKEDSNGKQMLKSSSAPAEQVLSASQWQSNSELQLKLLELDPPELPGRMSPGQAAQLAEVLEYIHLHMRRLISSAETSHRGQMIQLNQHQWQNLLDMQSRLAEYLRKIGFPNE